MLETSIFLKANRLDPGRGGFAFFLQSCGWETRTFHPKSCITRMRERTAKRMLIGSLFLLLLGCLGLLILSKPRHTDLYIIEDILQENPINMDVGSIPAAYGFTLRLNIKYVSDSLSSRFRIGRGGYGSRGMKGKIRVFRFQVVMADTTFSVNEYVFIRGNPLGNPSDCWAFDEQSGTAVDVLRDMLNDNCLGVHLENIRGHGIDFYFTPNQELHNLLISNPYKLELVFEADSLQIRRELR